MANRQQRREMRRLGTSVRNFSYEYGKQGQLGHSTLNFSLRTDVKEELVGYVELLEAALKDVKEEVKSK